ncbi:MAG: glycosyl transferase [Candidatus Moraniibacteriota bacterium]|nr:MAG: glycosyl transferase [Candidatus Moranbacteria bacterium]
MTKIKRKALMYFIIVALLLIVLGKVFFGTNNTSNLFLYMYGITVTMILCVVFFMVFTSYCDPYEIAKEELQKKDNNKKKPLFVTCMVAAWNEGDGIVSCIESMIAQTYQHREIIFVDDCSDDNTREIIERYEKKGLIKGIYLDKNVGKKCALGKAMRIAKGDIFAFSDSDSLWKEDALERIMAIFMHDKNVGGVSGHCRAQNAQKNVITRVQDSWYEGQFGIRKAFESIFGAITCVSGPLAVFRREAIYNYIPAWENDKFLGQEFRFATDRTLTGFVLGAPYIGKKLKKKYAQSSFVKEIDYPEKEWKIVYCKSARSWTIVPDTLSRVFRQQVRWKKSFIRNTIFTGSFYWHKHFLTAFVYYMHIIFVVIGPFVVFRHLVYMPLHGNWWTVPLYLSGILLVGFSFGLAYRLDNPDDDQWVYRPLMSLFSTLVLSWILFYSLFTIKKMQWSRN